MAIGVCDKIDGKQVPVMPVPCAMVRPVRKRGQDDCCVSGTWTLIMII